LKDLRTAAQLYPHAKAQLKPETSFADLSNQGDDLSGVGPGHNFGLMKLNLNVFLALKAAAKTHQPGGEAFNFETLSI